MVVWIFQQLRHSISTREERRIRTICLRTFEKPLGGNCTGDGCNGLIFAGKVAGPIHWSCILKNGSRAKTQRIELLLDTFPYETRWIQKLLHHSDGTNPWTVANSQSMLCYIQLSEIHVWKRDKLLTWFSGLIISLVDAEVGSKLSYKTENSTIRPYKKSRRYWIESEKRDFRQSGVRLLSFSALEGIISISHVAFLFTACSFWYFCSLMYVS